MGVCVRRFPDSPYVIYITFHLNQRSFILALLVRLLRLTIHYPNFTALEHTILVALRGDQDIWTVYDIYQLTYLIDPIEAFPFELLWSANIYPYKSNIIHEVNEVLCKMITVSLSLLSFPYSMFLVIGTNSSISVRNECSWWSPQSRYTN